MKLSTSVLFLTLSLLITNAFAATQDAEALNELASELNLSSEAITEVEAVIDDNPTPHSKDRVLFCVDAGLGAVVDMMIMNCRSLKGRKLEVSFIGLGASFSLHGGVAVLYPKKKSRTLNLGTYRHTRFGAVHVGMGAMGMAFKNDNGSINYRIRGLTLGAGFNAAFGIVQVRER